MKTTSDCIGIREYLLRRGLQPHRETATHGMFLSPLREEHTPSFSVRYDKGLWYDFGLGEGGTLLQLVMRLEGCGMAEAIRRLRKGSADEVPFQPLPTASAREDSPLRILSVGEIRHPALTGYLRERGIDPAVAGALCREIHYAVGERRFFAIGFRNDAGGWELRSPQFKGSSAPKSITTFDRHGDTALLFEGFFDLLSYLTLQHEPTPTADTAVLNSVVKPTPRPSVSRTPRDDPRLSRQQRGGALHPRTTAQRPARCDRYRPCGGLPYPQGSERIAPIVREGFPHAAASRPQVVTSPGMTPEPSPTHRPLRDRGFSPEEKAIAY